MVFWVTEGMKNAARILGASLVLVAVTGAGCLGSSQTRPPLRTAAQQQPYVPVPPPPDPEQTTPPSPRDELRAILQAFRDLKSFRSKITIPSKQGDITGTLDFQKPDRLHAILQAGTGDPTEIIVVDTSLYMRNAKVSWVNFSKSATAKKLGESIRSTMSGDSSLDKLAITDAAEITKTQDADNGCDLYSSTLQNASGKDIPVTVCAVNGLPKILTMDSSDGQIRLEYYDYNAVFLIERPRY